MPKNNTTHHAQPDMNPMLDIVFILLIFFIVTTSFNKPTALDIERNKQNQLSLTPTLTPQFYVTKDNKITLNNRLISADAIMVNLARLEAEGSISALSVTAHEHSTHNTLVHLLNSIKEYTSAPVSLGSR